MIVTKIVKEDYAQVLDIYNHYILNTTHTFELEPLNLAEFTRRIENILLQYPFLVLKEKDKVLGFGYLSCFNERKAYDISCDLSIYLAPDERHQGCGTQLWLNLLAKAKEIGIKNIISIITGENEASISFHQKLGFIEAGRLTDIGYKFGRYLDVVFYQYKLLEK